MNLSKKIKKAREERNLTQEQLANEINVSRKTISGWENERSIPDIQSIENLSNALDKNISYFTNKQTNSRSKIKQNRYVLINVLNIIIIFFNITILFVPIKIYGITFLNTLMLIIMLKTNLKDNNEKNLLPYKKYIISFIFTIFLIFSIYHSMIILNRISIGGLIGITVKTTIVTINTYFMLKYLEKLKI